MNIMLSIAKIFNQFSKTEFLKYVLVCIRLEKFFFSLSSHK
jgi:hypothetical protein